jgi:hypothetical protein
MINIIHFLWLSYNLNYKNKLLNFFLENILKYPISIRQRLQNIMQ